MLTYRYGGKEADPLKLGDTEDVVVVRTNRRGARHDVSPLDRDTSSAMANLTPLFGVASAGVGVYEAPPGRAEELSKTIHRDETVRFAGRGLRDLGGAPVIYTENVFVKFADGVSRAECDKILASVDLRAKRPLPYAGNAYFAAADEGAGRAVFASAEALLERDDVELCHPELIRELGLNGAFPAQWHLQETTIDGQNIDADASVTSAWELTTGEGIVIAVIDDGVDIDHEEFAGDGKIVAPRSISPPRSSNPRPAEGANHGTACAGVACANGLQGASGVAPGATLMPIRLDAGLGSQDEADAMVWAADNGADVISCSWGPIDGRWFDPDDPRHTFPVPLPDSTRLAINHAAENGRGGRGCVITWAAGNGNEDVMFDGYASYEKVIAVAACNDSGTKSVYSDFGDAVWCCFPSNDLEQPLTSGIWTTDRSGLEGYNPGDLSLGDSEGNYTNSFGGTSSACPGVAGVVALMLAQNPQMTPGDVKAALKLSSDHIDESNGEYDAAGHSSRYGFGRVNARAAVEVGVPTHA